MKIGLFIPCYVDQFYPQVGIATLQLLEKLGVEVVYPLDQTCCGQPAANAGLERYSASTGKLFVRNFSNCDYIVSPSGSCTYHVRCHFDFLETSDQVKHLREHTLELCEFISNVLKIEDLNASLKAKVGLHHSCHGLRGLRLGATGERMEPTYSLAENLLKKVSGLELISLTRKDECCGFGGLFSIGEEAVSVRMGQDRLADHLENGAEVITSTDMSCLMHLEGIIKRNKHPLKIKHIAEILNSI